MNYRMLIAKLKFLAIVIVILVVSGCSNGQVKLQQCKSRHYIVHTSTTLTTDQRDNFIAAMTMWTEALGEGFWTWEIQDKYVDKQIAIDEDIDSCVIAVIPADQELIGEGNAGLAITTLAMPSRHLIGGIVEFLDTIKSTPYIRRIALHEIGHLLGLDDSQTDTSSIMYYTIGGPPIEGLPPKDVEAVKKSWGWVTPN